MHLIRYNIILKFTQVESTVFLMSQMKIVRVSPFPSPLFYFSLLLVYVFCVSSWWLVATALSILPSATICLLFNFLLLCSFLLYHYSGVTNDHVGLVYITIISLVLLIVSLLTTSTLSFFVLPCLPSPFRLPSSNTEIVRQGKKREFFTLSWLHYAFISEKIASSQKLHLEESFAG